MLIYDSRFRCQRPISNIVLLLNRSLVDTYDFLTDPRTLTLAERREARDQYDRDQRTWLAKLRLLAEDPKPAEDFPAFLLATQTFADLARKLQKADSRKQLPTDVQDEVDWFVRAFADYLRTQDGEEVFPDTPRMTG
tara:strand:- start:41221 stop:41631 length:411 start_codon:yes stop_codon:yes gene_type:complete